MSPETSGARGRAVVRVGGLPGPPRRGGGNASGDAVWAYDRALASVSVSLFIVAEVRLFREGLAEALSRRERFEVLGAASNPEEALPRLCDLQPDVALIDVAQPSAVTTVRFLVDALPTLRVIALAVPELEPEVVRWAEEGTAGYVPRDAGLGRLEACIDSVARGETLCTPRMAAALLRRVAALA